VNFNKETRSMGTHLEMAVAKLLQALTTLVEVATEKLKEEDKGKPHGRRV
jgi:hypothetical protein